MAQHRYFVKEDPDLPAEQVRWRELCGEEYYELVSSGAGKGRYFANIGDFTIEMSKSEYRDWRKDRNREAYLIERNKDFAILPLHTGSSSEITYGAEMIPEYIVDIEEEALKSLQLEEIRKALDQLDEESRYIINELYFARKRKTTRQLANEFGITQTEIQRRKKKIMNDLKIFVFKGQKIQQSIVEGKIPLDPYLDN